MRINLLSGFGFGQVFEGRRDQINAISHTHRTWVRAEQSAEACGVLRPVRHGRSDATGPVRVGEAVRGRLDRSDSVVMVILDGGRP